MLRLPGGSSLSRPHPVSFLPLPECMGSFHHSLISRHGPLRILITVRCVSRSAIRTQQEWCGMTRILLRDLFTCPFLLHWLMSGLNHDSEITEIQKALTRILRIPERVKRHSAPSPLLYWSCRFPQRFRWCVRSTSFTQAAILWHFSAFLMRQAWRGRPVLRPATWQSLVPRAPQWALIPIYPVKYSAAVLLHRAKSVLRAGRRLKIQKILLECNWCYQKTKLVTKLDSCTFLSKCNM